MQHCLRRAAARRAEEAKLQLRVSLLAAQGAWGGSAASQAIEVFFAEMSSIVSKSSSLYEPPKPDENGLFPQDYAMFDAIAAQAEKTTATPQAKTA